MTTNAPIRPFITAFASPMESALAQTLRYDEQRQLSQVLIGDDWVDALLASESIDGGTRMTKVEQETTDDE